MSTAEVDVVVAVVTYNSAGVLPGLVNSLPAAMAGLRWHLVIADNASADGTPDLLREISPAATLVETGRNAGYAAGVNLAVAAAPPTEAVLVLNPDVRLGVGSGTVLLDALRLPGTGIAVPALRGADGSMIPSLRREPTVLRAWADALLGGARAGRWGALGEVVTRSGAYDRPATSDWAEGSTQLVSSTCLHELGPWDESYFLYSEETDFHLRARDAGYTLRFVPEASATHLEGDSASSPRLWALLTANRLALFRRRHGLVRSVLYWAALVLREGTRGLLGRPTSKAAARTLMSPSLLRAPRGPEWLERVG